MAQALASKAEALTLAELHELFGPMPAWRIRSQPAPGTATEEDWLALAYDIQKRCELTNGVLVEKPVGYMESRLATVLSYLIERFLETHPLGIVVGESAASRLLPGLIRAPDVSFVSWDRLPGRRVPREPLPNLAPELAVEILSKSNTKKEMDAKLHEYFAAGVTLVWYVDPRKRTARVYTSPEAVTKIGFDGVLSGGDVLPGFTVSLKEWFERADPSHHEQQ